MDNFRNLIHNCGLSLKGAARLLNVSYDSVRGWHCGRNPVPKGVIYDLEQYEKAANKIFKIDKT